MLSSISPNKNSLSPSIPQTLPQITEEDFQKQISFFTTPSPLQEDLELNNFQKISDISSILLGLPFSLSTYMLIKLTAENLNQSEISMCQVILGDIEMIRKDESILVLIFSLTEKHLEKLDLYKNYRKEIMKLKQTQGIEFIGVFENKIFIQGDSEGSTVDAHTSIKNSSNLLNLLDDEENNNNLNKNYYNNFEEKKEEKPLYKEEDYNHEGPCGLFGINEVYYQEQNSTDNGSNFLKEIPNEKKNNNIKINGPYNKFDLPPICNSSLNLNDKEINQEDANKDQFKERNPNLNNNKNLQEELKEGEYLGGTKNNNGINNNNFSNIVNEFNESLTKEKNNINMQNLNQNNIFNSLDPMKNPLLKQDQMSLMNNLLKNPLLFKPPRPMIIPPIFPSPLLPINPLSKMPLINPTLLLHLSKTNPFLNKPLDPKTIQEATLNLLKLQTLLTNPNLNMNNINNMNIINNNSNNIKSQTMNFNTNTNTNNPMMMNNPIKNTNENSNNNKKKTSNDISKETSPMHDGNSNSNTSSSSKVESPVTNFNISNPEETNEKQNSTTNPSTLIENKEVTTKKLKEENTTPEKNEISKENSPKFSQPPSQNVNQNQTSDNMSTISGLKVESSSSSSLSSGLVEKSNQISNNELFDIVKNKKYKEYIPKNHHLEQLNTVGNQNTITPIINSSSPSTNNNTNNNKNTSLDFKTNSTRDYQFKYVVRYIVQIENEKNFPVTKMIIGNNGMLLRNILYENCIKYGDYTTKIRLRGKGSGYKEGPKNEESKDPMELCISSLNLMSFTRCSYAIESMLLKVYYQYYVYQCKIVEDKVKELNGGVGTNLRMPVMMKKILKYQYTVNRFNTLAKEEKRRKIEEESKQSCGTGRKISDNNDDIDNNDNNSSSSNNESSSINDNVKNNNNNITY